MNRIYLMIAFSLIVLFSKAQFRNDNVLYKTIDPFELCEALQRSPGYVLLDVRSRGEYEDTSMYRLNYGRLKNAININVRELGQRIHELDAYKTKPVFIYCSHSQRSRRASKMLADSGFTNVNNINGGITSFHYLAALKQHCLQSIYETEKRFGFVSPSALCKKLSTNAENIFLLDVRSDSAYKHVSLDEKENALGYLNGSINIPVQELDKNLSLVPTNKEIIITDIYGQDAAEAADKLIDKGYTNVHVLIEGIDRMMGLGAADVPCKNTVYKPAVPYNFLSVTTFAEWAKSKAQYIVIDIRTANEYNNKDSLKYRNTGHLKNAVNIPARSINEKWTEIKKYKNMPLVLYGFGGGSETFEAAKLLQEKGFSKINILYDGIFAVRWTAANVKEYAWMKALVADIPEENQ